MDGQGLTCPIHVHSPKVLYFELSGTPDAGFADRLII